MKLYLDSEPELQPKGTYRFALNQVDDSVNGSQGALATELGNTVYTILPGQVLGTLTIRRNETIVFIRGGIIGNIRNNSFVELLNFPDLDFTNAIKAEHRVINGCEDVIYFYDGANPDRFFNISRPEVHQLNGVFDINLFNINPISSFPIIRTIVFNSGGLLELGKYFFAVQVTDQNENVIYTSQVSNGVTITDDEDGGLNLPVNLPQIGGVPASNKSIQIDVTNIGDYPFARIIVFRAVSGDGVAFDTYKVGRLLPIDNGLLSYSFTGVNDVNDVRITAGEVIVPKASYQRSKAQTQVDNRLIRANLVETIRDYSGYQRFASKIRSNYVINPVLTTRKEVITELGGEVKAYGICYVHRDGTISPVFHIPGPRKTEFDEGTLSITLSNVELDNSSISFNGTYEVVIVNGEEEGRFTLNYVFAEPITSGNIYFETQEFELQTQGTIIYQTPIPDVVNYPIIVQATIDGILYQGVMDVGPDISDLQLIPIGATANRERWQVHSTGRDGNFGYYSAGEIYKNPPNFCNRDYWGRDADNIPLINSPVRYHAVPDRHAEALIQGNTVRAIGVQFNQIDYPNDSIVGHFFVSNIRSASTSLVTAKGVLFNHGHRRNSANKDNFEGRIFETGTTLLHKLISNEYLFDKRSVSGEYVLVENQLNSTIGTYTFEENNYFPNTLPYRDIRIEHRNNNIASYNTIPRAYSNIVNNYSIPSKTFFEGITNNSVNNNLNILELSQSFGLTPKYVSVRLLRPIFPSVFNISYRRIGNLNQNRIFNGDAYISRLDLANVSKTNVKRRFFSGNRFEVEAEIINNIFIESTINANYRHAGTDECNDYYKRGGVTDYFIQKTTDISENKPIGRTSICPEFYAYNKDFSYVNTFNIYYPLPFTFNYCSDCLGVYPNRIIFSQKAFEEDLVDNYRTYLANDYVDIPANRGEIISIDYYNNKIIVRTKYSCFFLQPNPQQIQLSETTAFIGTGDFLSIPPQELNVNETGYAGQQNPISELQTEHGLIWVDDLNGKVFKLSNTLEEISREGMYHFFRNNLYGNTKLGYDPLFERLLLTNGVKTLSYSFKQKGWVSFHSHKPEWYFNNGKNLISIQSNAAFIHNNIAENATFYGLAYDAVVEFTLANAKAFNINSIQYYIKALSFDGSFFTDNPNITFQQGWVFNSNQSSGLFNIVTDNTEYGSISFSNAIKRAKITDKMHKISGIYNIARSNNITSDSLEYEVVPFDADFDMPQYLLAPFRDKYLRIRLFIKAPNVRIITNFVDGLKQEYER
jgi:hypothetical protein